MTVFRIDVVVDPRRAGQGTKRVERSLTSLEQKANRTQLALRKAIAFIGVGFAVRQLAELGDAFTNLQNRLRVVTDGSRELNQVTEELLQVSNRSRSSFESTSELYSRLALATRELNLEGANLINITESINKAIILSGASAKEANNGLIQLSQGLASGRLTGDELRSTLEQLPVVADVIAKQLGVTRGELRKLGAEGKITSIEIIRAFQRAENELETAFAETVPTLSQSFVVLRNNVVAFVGRINEGTGTLRAFGAALRFVGEELATIVKSFAVLSATIAAIKFAPLIQGFLGVKTAVEAVTVARAKSAATINLQNKLVLQQAKAQVAAAAAALASTDAIIQQTRVQSLNNAIKKGTIGLLFEQTALERQLQGAQAARAKQLATLIAAEKAQGAAALAAGKNVTFLSLTLGRARTAVNALTAAIAANPIGAFAVALIAVGSALTFFRNDIKLTEDSAVTLGDVFTEFFQQLKAALAGVSDLFRNSFGGALSFVSDFIDDFGFQFRDILLIPAAILDALVATFVTAFNIIIALAANLPRAIGSSFVIAINSIITAFEFIPDVVTGVAKTVASIIGDLVSGVILASNLMGQALDAIFNRDFAGAAVLGTKAGAEITKAFSFATEDLGMRFTDNIAKEIESDLLPRLENSFAGGVKSLIQIVAETAKQSIAATPVGDFALGLLSGAEGRADERQNAEATMAKAAADKAASNAALERFASIIKVRDALRAETIDLNNQIQLGQREAGIRKTQADIIAKLAKESVVLNRVELEALDTATRANVARREAIATGQQLLTTEQKLAERTRLANNAFDEGTISAQQLALELRNIDLAAAQAGTTMADGITVGIARIKEELMDLGTTVEDVLVNGMNAALDSLATGFQETFSFLVQNVKDGETSFVEFRDAIKATFKSAIDTILNEIAKLIIQLLILKAIQAATGTGPSGGIPTGGAGGELSLGDIGIPGAAVGSTAARANQPFVVGEEGPELFTPGQTGSITPTDQTIEALSGGAANSRETIVMQAAAPEVNVQTIVVDDPSKIPSAIESPEGRQAVRNVIRQDRSGIKQDLG